MQKDMQVQQAGHRILSILLQMAVQNKINKWSGSANKK